MPDTSKLEKLNRELEKSEKKLRKAINDEKALQHQLKQLGINYKNLSDEEFRWLIRILKKSKKMGTISIVLAVLLDMVIPFHFG